MEGRKTNVQEQKEQKSSVEKLLISSKIMTDGVGDFGHLEDALKSCEGHLPNKMAIDVLVQSRYFTKPDTLSKEEKSRYEKIAADFKKRLEARGYTLISVNPRDLKIKKLIDEYPNHKLAFLIDAQEINPNLDADNDVEKAKESSNRIRGRWISELIKMYKAHIAMSSCPSNLSDETQRKTCVLYEHGMAHEKVCDLRLEISMSLLGGTKSIFLSPKKKEESYVLLSKVLSKSKNKLIGDVLLKTGDDYFSELLNSLNNLSLKEKSVTVQSSLSSSEEKTKVSSELCKQFLADKLFVPGYIQHNPFALSTFVNFVFETPLSQSYKSIDFFINQYDDSLKCLLTMLEKELLSSKISYLLIDENGKPPVLMQNPIASQDAIPCRIMMGYCVEEDDDYDDIFSCGHFSCCSGDKTFEKSISNDQIPLMVVNNRVGESYFEMAFLQVPNIRKLNFLNECAQVDNNFYLIQSLTCFNCLLFEFSALAKREIKVADLSDEIKNAFSSLYYNLTVSNKVLEGLLKSIEDNTLKIFASVDKNVSTKTIQELLNLYLYTAIYPFIMQSTRILASTVDASFIKNWQETCSNLRENYNLHKKLPEIIDKFLKEMPQVEYKEKTKSKSNVSVTSSSFFNSQDSVTIQSNPFSFDNNQSRDSSFTFSLELKDDTSSLSDKDNKSNNLFSTFSFNSQDNTVSQNNQDPTPSSSDKNDKSDNPFSMFSLNLQDSVGGDNNQNSKSLLSPDDNDKSKKQNKV